MTARLDVTPKTTEQNRIVRTSKSEAKVTNNKKTALEVLYYWRNEANYFQTQQSYLLEFDRGHFLLFGDCEAATNAHLCVRYTNIGHGWRS